MRNQLKSEQRETIAIHKNFGGNEWIRLLLVSPENLCYIHRDIFLLFCLFKWQKK